MKTTEPQGIVVLAFGPQPLDIFSKVVKLAGKDAEMDSDIARMAGAMMAAGAPEALEALRARLVPGALQAHAASGVSAAAVRWLALGERGTSSNTIFTRLTGVDALDDDGESHPYDPDDLRRCRLLLEQVPELVPLFPRMADASPEWAQLVKQWGTLCALMDEEAPDWRAKRGSAPETYELMKKAIVRRR